MPVPDLHAPATLALVGAILWFAFFVRGISGFGSATVAIPLLAHVTPLKLAVPLLLVLDFAATLATLKIDRGLIEKREVRRLHDRRRVRATFTGFASPVSLCLMPLKA